ncbi:Scr1 family TA system antitoxin-like transcriptional regulator [Streptomyces acidicola]|uniref:Scr1 family TA system antitoxin-like transcriptional regulator n=1 Tax=Streptomyces acidicola TaxID=2596892 RepID=UPI00382D000B
MRWVTRCSILFAADPVPYTAIIHEAALRMRFGGHDVTREQLEHVIEMSELDHVTVLAIPYEAGIFPGAGQTVLYAEGPVPPLDTAQLDAEHVSAFLHADPQLGKYRTFMTRFEAVALKESASRDRTQRACRRPSVSCPGRPGGSVAPGLPGLLVAEVSRRFRSFRWPRRVPWSWAGCRRLAA